MDILSYIKDMIVDYLNIKLENKIHEVKLKYTIEKLFESKTLTNMFEQQGNNTYIYDFVNLLKDDLFNKIYNSFLEVDTNKKNEMRKEIFRDAYNLTDMSIEQKKNINELLEYIIRSIQYCWENSLDKNERYLLSKINDKEFNESSLNINSNQNEKPLKSYALKFKRKFYNNLFLETDHRVRLVDVYIKPDIIIFEKNEKVICKSDAAFKYLDNLILHKIQNKVLFISGKAGSGKSSFLYYLSAQYDTENIFYCSLKDLINNSNNYIDLYEDLINYFSLKNEINDKTLILDGFDEIVNLLDQKKFVKDLEKLHEENNTVIFTTRPGYLDNSMSKLVLLPYVQFGEISFFNQDKIKKWLKKYKKYNPCLRDETIQSIEKIDIDNKLYEIISIPIILYIISNQNIILDTMSSYGELYDMVFTNLTLDKSIQAKEKYNKIHYNIAKEIAYIMYTHNWMSISENYIINNLSIIFDKTFYSSVYMNRIMEGEYETEFVHKTFQDFFAAKWIWENLLDSINYEKNFDILSTKLLSSEIIEYIQCFYKTGRKRAVEDITRFFGHTITKYFYFNLNENSSVAIQKINIFLENINTIYNKVINNKESFKNINIKRLIDILNIIDFYVYHIDKSIEICKNFFEILNGLKLEGFKLLCNSPEQHYKLCKNAIINCDFSQKIVRDIFFESCDIVDCKFENSKINRLFFSGCTLEDINFYLIRFNEIHNNNCMINNVQFSVKSLYVYFDKCTVKNSVLSFEILKRGRINDVEFKKCKFCSESTENYLECQFYDNEFYDVYFENVTLYNCRLSRCKFINCKFDNTKFVNCDFYDVTFMNCNYYDKSIEDSLRHFQGVTIFEN